MHKSANQENQTVVEFLDRLTKLTREYSLGLTGKIEIFMMEFEDFSRSYSADAESVIAFE